MEWKQLFMDWRIILLIVAVIGAIVAIQPHYVETKQGEVTLATNIREGLDLQGGSRILATPARNVTQEEMDQIVEVLRSRVSAYGLQETKIRPVQNIQQKLVQLEVAGGNISQLEDLIAQQGRFEARIPFNISDTTSISLGDRTYTAEVVQQNTTTFLAMNNTRYAQGQELTLSTGAQNITAFVYNTSENTVQLHFVAFTGEDIVQVIKSTQEGARIQQSQNGWQFQFPVLISNTAAQRMFAVTQHLSVTQFGQNAYLNAPLQFYLDNERTNSLQIASSFKNNPVERPLISGGEQTEEAAVQSMQSMQSILVSGNLPTQLEIVSSGTIAPSLGQEFARTAMLAVFLAIGAVSIVVFIRYRRPAIAFPILITALCEVVIVLGVASAIHWTIDLAAIAGIIAAVGTGVDDQIVITDERLRRKEVAGTRARLKRAFFIIFTAFFTTAGAMLPLAFVGAGAVTGFALTTIIGVSIGVGITRPAYSRVLHYIEEDT